MRSRPPAALFGARIFTTPLRLATIALLTVVVLGVTPPLQAAQYSKLVMFGDSLSDTGNMYRLTKRRIPSRSTYYRGRYSNGHVWVEYLRSRLGVRIRNQAHGGALSGYTNLSGPYPGLRTQVDAYLAKHRRIGRRDLVVLWIGANDYFHQHGRVRQTTIINRATNNIATAVSQLSTAGAKSIVVLSLPNLGRTPYARQKNTASPGSLSRFSRKFNRYLRRALASTGIDLKLVDTYALLEQIQRKPERYGLSDARRSCLAVRCRNPRKFLFWDNQHLTTRGHQILAEYLLSRMRSKSLN